MTVLDQTDNQDDIHLFVEASFAEPPDWIPFLPTPGVYPHPTYGQIDLSPEAIDRYVSNFNDGVYGQRNIPVDLEHDFPQSGAMGYMREMRKNADGSVDARVEWNDRGKQVIAEKRFSYVSPTLQELWRDPVTLGSHQNVAKGAALTTRPYFKERSLRPLIVASEPAGTRQEELSMSEDKQTETKTPEQEATAIVDKAFGEKLALSEKANADLLVKFNESETARKAAEDRIAALEDAAQRQTWLAELKGCSDIDRRLTELKALPVDLHEGYIKGAQAERDARRTAVHFTEIGVDAKDRPASAQQEAAAKAREQKVSLSEVLASDPDLKKRVAAERAQA